MSKKNPRHYTDEEKLALSNHIATAIQETASKLPIEDRIKILQAIGKTLMEANYHIVKEDEDMAKFTVIIPVADTEVVRDHTGQITGLPYLGQSQRLIMNEDEVRDWFDSFLADSATGKRFYLERHPR